MTSPGDITPLDPDVFLERQPKKRLAAHDELISSLLRKGWSAYMIWRYLNDECAVVISRTAVYNACVRLKKSSVAPGGRAPTLSGKAPSTPATSAATDEAKTSAQTPSNDPVGGNLKAVSRADPHPHPEETVPRRAPDQNDGPDRPAFDSKEDGPPPKISRPGHSMSGPGRGYIRPYDRDDPALIAAAEEERKSWKKGGRDNQTNTSDHKGRQDG